MSAVDVAGAGIPHERPGRPAEEQKVAEYGQAWETNIKRIVDEWAALSQSKASAQASLQDQINGLFLKWAMDAQGVTNMVANNAAVLSARINSNAATVDNLVNVAAITNPAELAETSIGAKVAADVRDAVTQGIGAAVEQGVVSSPVAQGTTGVAQGAMQTATGIADAAILAQIAKLAEVVSVLAIKVLGEEATEVAVG